MRTVNPTMEAVPWLVSPGASRKARAPSHSTPSNPKEPEMADVLYVVLTVAAFAVLALIVKGVGRLER
jgi:hypothetical protein